MEDFTAEDALKLSNETRLEQFYEVIESIKTVAANGYTYQDWHSELEDVTVTELEKIGFKVVYDNYLYKTTISWDNPI